jgi:hypothetical protein
MKFVLHFPNSRVTGEWLGVKTEITNEMIEGHDLYGISVYQAPDENLPERFYVFQDYEDRVIVPLTKYNNTAMVLRSRVSAFIRMIEVLGTPTSVAMYFSKPSKEIKRANVL